MKNEKGITLISLIIYIILLLIVATMLSTMSMFFYSNAGYLEDESKNISEYNKFNMYFIEDVKSNKNVQSINSNEIIFNDGTVYTYISEPDNGIYRNKVKICEHIENCTFSRVAHETKNIINVKININESNFFETDNNYVLKYW